MAYASLVNKIMITPDSAGELFQHIRDFVCKRNGTFDYSTTGIGWVLHDSSYAVNEDTISVGDYVVMYSTGESGDERMYYKMSLGTTTYIYMTGYTYWNNTTHTGGTVKFERVGSPYSQISTNAYRIFIYGDLDYVHHLALSSSGAFVTYSFQGKLDTPHFPGRTVQTCSSPLSAGSGVSIVVGDSTDPWWKVGNEIIIFDGNYLEQITIISNNNSDTITANLVNSYSAGAKLSVIFPYIVDGRLNYVYSNTYFYGLHNGSGTVNISLSKINPVGHSLLKELTQNNWRYAMPIWIYNGDEAYGTVPHSCRIIDVVHEDVYEDEYGNDWRNFVMEMNLCIKEG